MQVVAVQSINEGVGFSCVKPAYGSIVLHVESAKGCIMPNSNIRSRANNPNAEKVKYPHICYIRSHSRPSLCLDVFSLLSFT